MKQLVVMFIGFILKKGQVTMECKCGGRLEVTLVEAVALLKCSSCGRGEHIPQAKPQEVFDFRARVGQATGPDKLRPQ